MPALAASARSPMLSVVPVIRSMINDSNCTLFESFIIGRACNPIDDKRLEQRAVLLQIEKIGIREPGGRCAARCAGEGKHSVLVCNQRVGVKEDSFDPTEHGRVGADAQGQAKNREQRKPWIAKKHSNTEAQVLEKF